jgi:hypothetical protein
MMNPEGVKPGEVGEPGETGELGELGKPVEPVELKTQSSSLYAINPPSIKNQKELTPGNKLRGGSSLYSSLSQTAYTLAPTATLLGIAAYLMSNKQTNKSMKRRKGGLKSRKRRH